MKDRAHDRVERRYPTTLWWIVGLSLVLKLLLIAPAADLKPVGDQRNYLKAGWMLVEHGRIEYANPVWDEAHAPPVMPYFMAACYKVAGVEWYRRLVILIQVILSTLSVLLVYSISIRFLPRRTSLLASGMVAFYPPLVAFSHYIWNETIYIFLLLAVIELLLRAGSGGSRRWALAAGLLGGVTALTRSIFLLQLPLVALWLLACAPGTWRRKSLLAGLFAAGMFAIIMPWSVRQTLRYDRFLLIDTNTGNVLQKNLNVLGPENHDVGMSRRQIDYAKRYARRIPYRPRVTAEHPVDRNSQEIEAGLGYLAEYPVHYLRQTGLRFTYFTNPTSFLIRHLRRNLYGPLPPLVVRALVWGTLASTMLWMLFSVIGLTTGPWGRERLLLALLALGHAAVHIALIAMSRYRLPLVPLLAPLAADALLRLPALLALPANWRRWVAIVPIFALLIWVWIDIVPLSIHWLE